mgnify:CR=1 FL=1
MGHEASRTLELRPLARRLLDVHQRLFSTYGPQHWWPAETTFEVVVGAILTQSAAWTNVEKALHNLRTAGALSPAALHSLDVGEIARLIRPSGYYNTKARRLKAFVEMLAASFESDLDALLALPEATLRRLLLSTYGVGPETADSILLYAAGRPVFVIDAYTRRVFSRLGIRPREDSYHGWQTLFMASLAPDAALFNEYHALIVRLAKDVCRKRPCCRLCPLLDDCPTGSLSQA